TFVLLRDLQFALPTDDAASFTQGPALLKLTRDGWVRHPLPEAIDPANAWELTTIGSGGGVAGGAGRAGAPAIIERTGSPNARVWFLNDRGEWHAQSWAIPPDARTIIPS